MKLRKILIISLVMALGLLVTGSIASARPAADLTEHLEWEFELTCDGGGDFWSKAVFWWTYNGESVGKKVVLRCTGSDVGYKIRFMPDNVNDWHVKIVARDADSGLRVTCFADQSWTGAPPLVYYGECVLANGMEAEFSHGWTEL